MKDLSNGNRNIQDQRQGWLRIRARQLWGLTLPCSTGCLAGSLWLEHPGFWLEESFRWRSSLQHWTTTCAQKRCPRYRGFKTALEAMSTMASAQTSDVITSDPCQRSRCPLSALLYDSFPAYILLPSALYAKLSQHTRIHRDA